MRILADHIRTSVMPVSYTHLDVYKRQPYINEERKLAGSTLLVHDIFTNGIAYIKLLFDLKQVPAELFPYVGILKSVLMGVNTEHYSYGCLLYTSRCV